MATTPARWEPFGMDLPAWMRRMFEERPSTLFEGVLDRSFLRVEQYVEDGTLIIRAEMPGIDIDKDVDISVHDGLLHIKAERSEKEEQTDKSFYHSEFRYGAFERTLPLPAEASVDEVKATYQNGILEVRVPMSVPPKDAIKVAVTRKD